MVSQPGQGPIPSGSAHYKDVSKTFYYLYSTMKTKDTEMLGRQRAKPSKIKA